MMSTNRMLAVTTSLWLLMGLAACGAPEVQRQLEELAALSAEKDSLLVQVTENARLMSEISAEMARVQAAPAGGAQETPMAVTRENILENITALTNRVIESETRLAESETRIQTLTQESSSQQSRLAEFQKTIREFQSTIENQKQTIASLTQQVNNLQEENIRLASENTSLTERNITMAQTVEEMEAIDNTVYYVVGTKEELIQRGVVEEEGGSRVLFVFGKRGKTLVPARDLNIDEFTPTDKRYFMELTLPEQDKDYRIVTRQDLSSLATPVDEDGGIRGTLRIADPERFWANTGFLILVRS